MKPENRKRTTIIFLVTLILVLAVFAASVIKTNTFNAMVHTLELEGASPPAAERSWSTSRASNTLRTAPATTTNATTAATIRKANPARTSR